MGFQPIVVQFAKVSLDRDEPDAPREDYARLRSLVAERFPSFGFYNVADPVISELGEAVVSVGDALDDIADIARDLSEVVWRFDHTTENDALWSFWLSYDIHLRSHVCNLQVFLEAYRHEPLTP